MNKEFLTVLLGRIVIALIGLVALRLLTHFLEPEQYGELALLNSVQLFCSLILVSPIGQFINVNTHRWHDEQSITSRLFTYKFYLIIVAGLGSLIAFLSIFNTNSNPLVFIIVVGLTIFAINWNGTIVPMLNMLGHRSASVFWGVMTILLATSFSTIFVILLEPTALSWLAGQGLGMLLGALGAKVYLNRNVNEPAITAPVSWLTKQNLRKFCIPLMLVAILMWLSQSGYRFIIEYFWGLEKLAFFVVGFSVAAALWSVLEAIASQFLYPYFFKGSYIDEGKSTSLFYSDLINILIPVYIIICGAMYVAAPYLLKILVSDQYQSALFFFMAGIFVEGLRVSVSVISLAAHVSHRTQALIGPYAFGAVLVILSIPLLGIGKFEINTVAYILITSSLALLVYMAVQMFQIVSFKIDFKNWLFILLMFVFMVVISGNVENVSWSKAILSLMLIGIGTGGFLFFFLRKNISFQRLINISIK